MTEKGKQWLNAGIKLGENPNIKVLCPNCQDSNLNVKDVLVDLSKPNLGGERLLFCPKCDMYEALLFRQFKENLGEEIDNNI
jgi:hypothetical protein